MRRSCGWLVGGLCAAVFQIVVASPVEACSPGQYTPTALPRSGATGVSTATSIVVLAQGLASDYVMQAAGQDVPLMAPIEMGAGADGMFGGLSFAQLRPATADGMLVPSAEHVLTANFGGTRAEVTRFTTAAGYDKVAGVAPVLRAVHLWRVRYPVSEISSGDCVFAEYHGFITVDYDPATIPNTPASSVVHTFQLRPKTGGSTQSFSYVGDTPFTGLKPTGTHPLPLGEWQPELDPTREYCVTVSAFGDGDIARLPVGSQTVCANVVQLSSEGAPSSGGGGGGCAVAGATDAATPAGVLLFALALACARRRALR